MRPQGFGQGVAGLEDLGWNDMGFEPPKPAQIARDTEHDAFGEDIVEHPKAHPTGLTPIGSPVHEQQADLADMRRPAERVADQRGGADHGPGVVGPILRDQTVDPALADRVEPRLDHARVVEVAAK